jgi:hypothetical protein
VKNLRISWKLVALFLLGAIGSGFYITRLRAFTLVEAQYLPAVQLVASQSAIVAVSNISPNDLDVTITTYGILGHILSTRSDTLAPGATSTLVVIAKGPMVFRTTVALGTQGAAVSDVELLDKTTGQVNAVLLPAVQ